MVINLNPLSFLDAAKHVGEYLSKPYTLKTCPFPSEWEYRYEGATVHRPNHGSLHAWRTASYVSVAVKIHNLVNPSKISDFERENLELVTLFYVTGRENEATHPDPAHHQFHLNSANYFEKYVQANYPNRFTAEQLKFYKDAVINPYSKPNDHQYHIIIICHNLDLLRCKARQQYQKKYLADLSGFIYPDYIKRLAEGAEQCLLVTGDRIFNERNYVGSLFVECHQNVQVALSKIEQALKSKLGEFMTPLDSTGKPSLPEGLRDKCQDTPWHFSRGVTERLKNAPIKNNYYRECEILPSDKDFEFVQRYVLHHPPIGYGITKVMAVINTGQSKSFERGFEAQEQDANNPKLALKGKEREPKEDRAQALRRWEEAVTPFSPVEIQTPERVDTYEKTKVLPVFHGTTELESVCSSGFTYFGKASGVGNSTDRGFFGSGYYFTTSASYAWKYSLYKAKKYGGNPRLLLAWTSMRNPFPVVNDVPHPVKGSDMIMLLASDHVDNYNAHYIPVANIYPDNPDSLQYYPCYQKQKPAWDEIVVFDKNQTLLQFWLELKTTNTLPVSLAAIPEVKPVLGSEKPLLIPQASIPPAQPPQVKPSGVASPEPFAAHPVPAVSPEEEAYQKGLECLKEPVSDEKLNQASEYFKNAASNNHAAAQSKLGDCYYGGKGVIKDDKEAFAWYQKAANQEAAQAQCQLGDLYYYGRGAAQNYKLAVEWYQKAATQGNADAQYRLGNCYKNGQGVEENYKLAVEWYQKGANQEHAEAQYSLGSYYYCEEVERNYALAVEWYQKAANQGNAQAQYLLGYCYSIGCGINRNNALAVEWYQKAANQGGTQAQYFLGKCYQNGEGVEQNLKLAFKWFRKAADQGDDFAQYSVGFCYLSGEGVEQNDKLAIEWFQKAENQGNAEAQYRLGNCYKDGKGVEQNRKLAIEWYQKAADQGYVAAQCKLGNIYMSSEGVEQNYKLGIGWYQKAADQGDVTAQYLLGNFYSNGAGVEQNDKMAFEWYQKAASNALTSCDAQYKLGYCYFSGQGVTQNYTSAVEWFEKAARNNWIVFDSSKKIAAQCLLGTCYYHGLGVAQNDRWALRWFRISAEQGNASAQNNLGNCYKNGQGVEQNDKLALEWYQKAAEQKNSDAQNSLGNCYYRGIGVEKNYALAVEWYQKAANQGDTQAQYSLGNCYYIGEGVEKNYELAFEWYQKAATQGNANAQYLLGNCYRYGRGVEKNYELAFEWYQKAATQGNANAQDSLGNCYYYDLGIEKNYKLAVEWYQKATTQGNADAQDSLGNCYYYGRGVEKNYKLAVECYQKAADKGNASAQNNLGNCYMNGRGVEENDKLAIEWYQKAASQGNADSRYLLENFYNEWYKKGLECLKEPVSDEKLNQAFKYFKSAASNNHVAAQSKLGDCYYWSAPRLNRTT